LSAIALVKFWQAKKRSIFHNLAIYEAQLTHSLYTPKQL